MWRHYWGKLRASKYGDAPFVLLGIAIGWNCDVSCAVKGGSMLPTLSPGEYITFLPYTLLSIRRLLGIPLVEPGNIVVLKVSDHLSVCKRVIKTTKDAEVSREWGTDYFVEDVPSPYASNKGYLLGETPEEGVEEMSTVSESEYYEYLSNIATRSHDWDACIDRVPSPSLWIWLEGDNSKESFDSRQCGPVPVECVRGLVLGSIWPTPHRLTPRPVPHATE